MSFTVGNKAGKDFLLKQGDGATPTEAFVTIGGLRSSSIKMNAEEIDVTNVGSSQWKELLDGAGIVSMTISGSGVYQDDAAFVRAQSQFLAQALTNYEIIDLDGNTFKGKFKIKSLERQGEYNKAQTWQISLQSSGAITYTPAV